MALYLSAPVVAQMTSGPADFGQPPSGAVPILFNDHHVYAKPDELRKGRLLAALVQNGQILVPLRSTFALMGAQVSYDPASRSAVIRRGPTTIRLTVGLPQVTIDAEVRPLEVAPEIANGAVLVPIRVAAEALGAYVEYERDKRAVVIRYLTPAGTVPAPPPSPVALGETTPAPVVTPRPPRATVPPGPPIPVDVPGPETYVAADVVVAPQVYNQYSAGQTGASDQSFDIRAAAEFSIVDAPFVLDGEYARFTYPHPAGFVTDFGKGGAAFIPAFTARDSSLQLHFGAQVNPEKFYLALAYAELYTGYGVPRIGGFGAGLEKLPVLSDHLSYDGSVFYYPNVSGNCTCPGGSYDVSYALLTYRAGLTYSLGRLFLDAGYLGENERAKNAAPIGVSRRGPYAGLGAKF